MILNILIAENGKRKTENRKRYYQVAAGGMRFAFPTYAWWQRRRAGTPAPPFTLPSI